MSVLRKIAIFFGGFLFSTFLATAILTLSLVQLTEYNNLKSIAINVSEEQVMQQITQHIDSAQLATIHAQLLELCKGTEKIEVPFDNESLTINCSDIANTKPEDLGKIIITSKFNEIYYKKYDCEFLDCLQKSTKEPMILFSSKANNLFKEILNYLLVGTAVGAIILGISTKGWGRIKSFGTCCICAGIPFFVINIIKGMLPIPKEFVEVAEPIIEQTFSSISVKFLIVFVAGIILFILGVAGEFLKRKKVKKK